jgi:hypothetical protein
MQQVAKTELKCANCRIAIRWIPAIVDGQAYCCMGCTDGGPCTCDYSHLSKTGASFAIELRRSKSLLSFTKIEIREVTQNV